MQNRPDLLADGAELVVLDVGKVQQVDHVLRFRVSDTSCWMAEESLTYRHKHSADDLSVCAGTGGVDGSKQDVRPSRHAEDPLTDNYEGQFAQSVDEVCALETDDFPLTRNGDDEDGFKCTNRVPGLWLFGLQATMSEKTDQAR